MLGQALAQPATDTAGRAVTEHMGLEKWTCERLATYVASVPQTKDPMEDTCLISCRSMVVR